jgi:hypothetical protein
MLLISSDDIPRALRLLCTMQVASAAVCVWNSAGYDILKSTFSDVRTIWALELEWAALEGHVVEAPHLGRQHQG